MKNAFERMGRRAVSLLMVVCLMLGMVGTAFAADKKEQAEMEFGMAVGSVIGGATIKDKVEAAKAIAADIIANYESKYELAYGYAKESGYVDAAVVALAVAEYAMDDAIAYVEQTYGDKIDIFRACARIVDIHAKGVSKLNSARLLQQELGKKILVCVGDAENDIPMLDGADYGFCPADAMIADSYENVCPCGEGAVADVIYEKIPEILKKRP